ncbi:MULTISPECIES: carboxyl transferase domain-containing protein [unclassified Ketobacter]|uniref:carboxyl transferase domain-containing protein n=1 Tax=unclassified Ketobacter TaxID=2639109 RepID=UPI000F1A0156|nr:MULTISPECIES: carboxyl transferase domain-containing protein [unclassified Ketobacter]RLT90177.1 MAG: hypothetical protein D9N13_11215 [Ketobacter sp. GenoA1]RLT93626.1 MAG: hypothetical protein D9N15_20185 [Ketobacter sp.]
MNVDWVEFELTKFSFFRPLSDLGINKVQAWLPVADHDNIRRASSDGTWLFRTQGLDQDFAVIWSDFRVNGGSFGRDIARRIASFLEACNEEGLPLITVMNSLGYRFIEGRTVFNDVFNLIPALDNYTRNNLVISVCHGQCLGLSAVLFGLAHYRIGVRQDSTLNLTGPDVFRLFFGSKVDFLSFASVDQQYLKTTLIHERTEDLKTALNRACTLLGTVSSSTGLLPMVSEPGVSKYLDFMPRQQQKVERACIQLLYPIADRYLEVFSGFDSRMRVYLIETKGKLFGLLMNPPENSNNMITVRTLKLYQDALRLFEALRIPIVSFLDTPGVDPRVDNSNQDVIQQMIEANRAIIEYPYPKMGVWIGRGFGGANTLAIPRIYGSMANYVILERTTLGVMHESIIAHLLEKSKRMLKLWQASKEREQADFQDIVDTGVANKALSIDELPAAIQHFLEGDYSHLDDGKAPQQNSQAPDSVACV